MTLLCRHHATIGRVLRRRLKEDVMKTNLNLDSALRTFARLTNLAKLKNRDKVTFSVTFSVPSSSLMRGEARSV